MITELGSMFYMYAENCLCSLAADISPAQIATLDRLEEALEAAFKHPDNDGWDRFFLRNPIWEPVREAARVALDACGWRFDVPPPDDKHYRSPENSRCPKTADGWSRDFQPKFEPKLRPRQDGFSERIRQQWEERLRRRGMDPAALLELARDDKFKARSTRSSGSSAPGSTGNGPPR